MNKQLQTVYIPTKVENASVNFIPDKSLLIVKEQYELDKYWTALVKPTEAYVFLPEELKELLEEYTNRIVENVKLGLYSDGVLREHVNGVMVNREDYYGTVYVDNKSITSQLPKFLKEKGYE